MKKLDIKRALREHHMTQVELCKRTGLLTQNMSPIINGNPTISKLMQVAEGIGCDITDLFYPDPDEEAEMEKENPRPTMKELQDIMRKAYPSIKKESIEDIVKMIDEEGRDAAGLEKLEEVRRKHEGETLNATLRGDLPEGIVHRDVKFVQQAAESEPTYPVHKNGLVSENQQQQMIQTSTFCPHCGKKVRVGVVLLDD